MYTLLWELLWWCICDTHISPRVMFAYLCYISFLLHVSRISNRKFFPILFSVFTLKPWWGAVVIDQWEMVTKVPKKRKRKTNLLQYYCKLYYCINYTIIYTYMYYTRAYLLLSTYLFTFIQRMPSHHSYCISLDLYAINTM